MVCGQDPLKTACKKMQLRLYYKTTEYFHNIFHCILHLFIFILHTAPVWPKCAETEAVKIGQNQIFKKCTLRRNIFAGLNCHC